MAKEIGKDKKSKVILTMKPHIKTNHRT
jgi:hypothetical protein